MTGPDVRTLLPATREGFGCISADPPWRFDDRGSRVTPKYGTLSADEIAQMPVAALAAPRGYLFLWVPSALLESGFRVVREWGFRFVATMVWTKTTKAGRPHIAMGHHVRNAHEIVLVGERGGMTALDRGVPSWIGAPRTEHSTKPEAFADAFERLAPGPRLELFARRTRPGWLCWGNEIDESAAWAAFHEPEKKAPPIE